MINSSSDHLRLSLSPSNFELNPSCKSIISLHQSASSVRGKSLKAESRLLPKDEASKYPLPIEFVPRSRKAARSGDVTDFSSSYKTHRVRTRKTTSKTKPSSEVFEKPKITYKSLKKIKPKPTPQVLVTEESKMKTCNIQNLISKSARKLRVQKIKNKKHEKENRDQAANLKRKQEHKNSEIRKTNLNKFKSEKFNPKTPWGVDQRKIDGTAFAKLRADGAKLRNKRRNTRQKSLSAGRARIGISPILKLSQKITESSPEQSPPARQKTSRPQIKAFIKKKNKQKKKNTEDFLIKKEAREIKRIISLKQLCERQKRLTRKKSKKTKKNGRRWTEPDEDKMFKIQNPRFNTDPSSFFRDTDYYYHRGSNDFQDPILETDEMTDQVTSFSHTFDKKLIKIQSLVRGFLLRRQLKHQCSRSHSSSELEELSPFFAKNSTLEIEEDEEPQFSAIELSQEKLESVIIHDDVSGKIDSSLVRSSISEELDLSSYSIARKDYSAENSSNSSIERPGAPLDNFDSENSQEEEDSMPPGVYEISELILDYLISEFEPSDFAPIYSSDTLNTYLDLLLANIDCDEVEKSLTTPFKLDPFEILQAIQEADIGTAFRVEFPLPPPVVSLDTYLQLENNRHVNTRLLPNKRQAIQIENKMFFDALNESLKKFKETETLPWANNRPVSRPKKFAKIQPEVFEELMFWNEMQGGVIPKQSVEEDVLTKVREMRLSKIIINDIYTQEGIWTDYFYEETQVVLDIGDMILETLITDTLSLC